MAIRLDPRRGRPIYLQIVEQIRQAIAAGKLKPADQLPTVRGLAAELRIDPNTVARAYRQLSEEGHVSTQQGRGTYVMEQPAPADQRRRRERLAAMVDSFLSEADRLGVPADELARAWGDRFALWQKSKPGPG